MHFCSLVRCSKSDGRAGVALIFSSRRVMLMECTHLTWDFSNRTPVIVPSAFLVVTNTFEVAMWVKMRVPVKSTGMTCKPLMKFLPSPLRKAGKKKEHHNHHNKCIRR